MSILKQSEFSLWFYGKQPITYRLKLAIKKQVRHLPKIKIRFVRDLWSGNGTMLHIQINYKDSYLKLW